MGCGIGCARSARMGWEVRLERSDITFAGWAGFEEHELGMGSDRLCNIRSALQ